MRKWSYLGAVLIPLFTLLWGIHFSSQMGPYSQLGNHDPDYAYLFNSLNITQGAAPVHIDHPGTPTQILGALVLSTVFAVHCPGNCDSLLLSVLNHSEFYLHAINFTFQILILLVFTLFGLQVLKVSQSLLLMFLAELTLFWASDVLGFLRKVAAEPFLIIVGLSLSLFLVRAVFTTSQRPRLRAMALGCIIGTGVAIKFNFIPFLMLGLIWGDIGLAGIAWASAGLTFILVTAPIWVRYNLLYTWVYNLLFHTGRHGYGAEGVINYETLLESAHRIWESLSFFVGILACTSFFWLWSLRRQNLKIKTIGLEHRALALVLICIAANIALVLKHPGNWYLTPSFMVATSVFPICYAIANKSRLNWGPVAFFLLAISIYVSFLTFNDWKPSRDYVQKSLAETSMVDKVLSENSNCRVVYYYPSSNLGSALAFGNSFSGDRYITQLQLLKPNYLAYNFGTNKLMSWAGSLNPEAEKTIFGESCVLLAGVSLSANKVPEGMVRFKFTKIFESNENGVYRMEINRE